MARALSPRSSPGHLLQTNRLRCVYNIHHHPLCFYATRTESLCAVGPPQTGIMDVDICGPSIPTILGIANEQVHSSASGWSPVYVQDNLGVMSVGFMLPSAKDAVMWRGPKKNGLIAQFLKDVDWGDLDWLVVDTPPGTSDEHLSVVQYLKESAIDGAILVTTPQEVALQDVRREIDFCKKVGVRIIGLVENMAGFVCPNCKTESRIFKPTTGGARRLAKETGVEFLGSIPLDPRIGKSADYGVSFLDEYPDSPATTAYLNIIDRTFLFLFFWMLYVKRSQIVTLHALRNRYTARPRSLNRSRSAYLQRPSNMRRAGHYLSFLCSPNLHHHC